VHIQTSTGLAVEETSLPAPTPHKQDISRTLHFKFVDLRCAFTLSAFLSFFDRLCNVYWEEKEIIFDITDYRDG